MAKGVVFSRDDGRRISDVVRRIEGTPQGSTGKRARYPIQTPPRGQFFWIDSESVIFSPGALSRISAIGHRVPRTVEVDSFEDDERPVLLIFGVQLEGVYPPGKVVAARPASDRERLAGLDGPNASLRQYLVESDGTHSAFGRIVSVAENTFTAFPSETGPVTEYANPLGFELENEMFIATAWNRDSANEPGRLIVVSAACIPTE